MKAPKPIVEIVGTGRYLPPHIMTNADLERMVGRGFLHRNAAGRNFRW
jgi:3-oxoacyl-[acyl-carrier-protein] synthase III